MLYIHIPFCKQRCIYCDFYSTIFNEEKSRKYVSAVCKEIELLEHDKCSKPLDSIYIGGGTPSVLNIDCLEKLLESVKQHFCFNQDYEFTIELNPDDVTTELITFLRNNGINRISLGVQSFNDEQLRFLNRRHNATRAKQAVEIISNSGINNISIDLIYGLPNQTLEQWNKNIHEALCLPIQHISAYSLMYEDNTPLYKLRESGKIVEADEQLSFQMYKSLCSTLKAAGFEHYEISNFCLPNKHSRHNSGYWNAKPYIGIGAGAHSFDGTTRYFNEENVDAYIQKPGHPPRVFEKLSLNERINEYIFTSLRTAKGLNIIDFQNRFGRQALNHIHKYSARHISNKHLQLIDNQLKLTEDGIFLSDDIMSDLMIVD